MKMRMCEREKGFLRTERETHDALGIGRIRGAPNLIPSISIVVSNQRFAVCKFGVMAHRNFCDLGEHTIMQSSRDVDSKFENDE